MAVTEAHSEEQTLSYHENEYPPKITENLRSCHGINIVVYGGIWRLLKWQPLAPPVYVHSVGTKIIDLNNIVKSFPLTSFVHKSLHMMKTF